MRAVADLLPGDGLGEISLLLDEPTTATVRALRDGVAIRFRRPAFMQLLELSPSAPLGRARARPAPEAGQRRSPRPRARAHAEVALLPLHGGLDVVAFAAGLAAAPRALIGRVELC